MANRWRDWFRQAERDLEQAKASRDAGRHEWACFAAHQAAEKALKAIHLSRGQDAWGHVLSDLLRGLPGDVVVPEGLVPKAQVLDNFYVPARYPNGHASGAPFEHYGPLQSGDALSHAQDVLDFARKSTAEEGDPATNGPEGRED